MSVVKAIFKKEFLSVINSPIFLMIVGACTLIWSYGFIHSVFTFADKSMKALPGTDGFQLNIHYSVIVGHISYVNIVLLFAVPAITMRLIAEERRQRTFDLLATSPIQSYQIICGKYFGALAAVLMLVLISMIYPAFLSFYSKVPLGALLSSYLGLSLLASLYVAIGLFASSLSTSSVLAVTLGVLFNMMIWFVGQGVEVFGYGTGIKILQYLSVGDHFTNFLKGVISLSSVVFLVSSSVGLVFLSDRIVESIRWR